MATASVFLSEEDKPPWTKVKLYSSVPSFFAPAFIFSVNLIPFPNSRQNTLEKLRSKISEYENTNLFPNDNWEYYKKIANPYELVFTQAKYPNFPPSVSIQKPLSRSYFKMVEIMEVFQFFQEHKHEINIHGLRTAHACEGPGGFIEAIFDLADRHKTRIQSSTAMTLKSAHSSVPGWRRASNFLSRNKQIHIVYGEDKTGDILKHQNQLSFTKSLIENGGKVHLYTADGGLDFSDNYENQELKIFPILLASARIGIASLRKGGMMILKFFDIQNENTKQLIFLLQLCFTKWTLYKPAMSRPCNPEQYFIGMNFRYGMGAETFLLSLIDKWQGAPPGLFQPFHLGVPSEFTDMLNNIQSELIEFQIKYLNLIFNIIHAVHDEFHKSGRITNDMTKELLKINEKKSYEWCLNFRIPRRPLS